ncbi:MAG: signal peptidase I [Deltaproteobacteria bacterium]|nr:signal peptidase I [Deltaproteobacteria bacterium]
MARTRTSAEDEETAWERGKANAKTIVGAVLLAFFIRIVLFEAFEIEGPSMEPTLLNGDRVVVAKFAYGLFLPFTTSAMLSWGEPERGDVVIVNSPHDNIDIVKRVIGLPGDAVWVEDDIVYLNDEAVPQEELGACADLTPHLSGTTAECIAERIDGYTYRTSREMGGGSADSQEGHITVPPGHVFILGDHRDRSNDSRFFGTVPINRIKGRALMMYWSTDPLRGYRWDRIFDSVQ